MAREFKELAHLKTDKKKFEENFDQIDWGDLKNKPIKKVPSRHSTAGLCGEYGLSTFDEKAYKENFDNIDWEPKTKATKEELETLKEVEE